MNGNSTFLKDGIIHKITSTWIIELTQRHKRCETPITLTSIKLIMGIFFLHCLKSGVTMEWTSLGAIEAVLAEPGQG